MYKQFKKILLDKIDNIFLISPPHDEIIDISKIIAFLLMKILC